ncbi:MAG: DUF484 family protein [Gammaproteobacteria bacterium]|nr:DUF484 family protein [Gammaproteobacteria bacterium]
MAQANSKSNFNIDDLISYLRDNPHVFLRHPELLELIDIPDKNGTASLLERQFANLKERMQEFQSQQSEFIQVARENEQISDSLSKVIYQLVGFTNLSEFASEFPKSLRDIFKLDEVTIKTTQAVSRRPDENQGYADALRRLGNNQAVSDNRWPSRILSLFFSKDIKSAALIPMRTDLQGETLGILALGSNNPERYTIELGSAHLNRLGMMSGICLARLQPEN